MWALPPPAHGSNRRRVTTWGAFCVRNARKRPHFLLGPAPGPVLSLAGIQLPQASTRAAVAVASPGQAGVLTPLPRCGQRTEAVGRDTTCAVYPCTESGGDG
jgi:hypothetical protein